MMTLKTSPFVSLGGAQVQSLTPTPLKHFGPLKGRGGGGAAGLGSRVRQHTSLKMIPSSHWSFGTTYAGFLKNKFLLTPRGGGLVQAARFGGAGLGG